MTQVQLGDELSYRGPSRAVSVSRLENGEMPRVISKLPALATALQVSEDDLRELALSIDSSPRRGSGKGGRTTSDHVIAALAGEKALANQRWGQDLADDIRRLDEKYRDHTRMIEHAVADARTRLIEPFAEFATQSEGIEAGFGSIETNPSLDSVDREQARRAAFESVRSRVASEFGRVSITAGIAGTGVGAAAAAGTYAAVGMLATASTGTAISSLAGSAATSATLAWLGGGSLAAGGAGVAGGTAVIAGIFALPAVAALAGGLIYQGRKFRRRAEKDRSQVERAQAQYDITHARMERAFDAALKASNVIRVAVDTGAPVLEAFHDFIEPGTPYLVSRNRDPRGFDLLSIAIDLVTAVFVLQSLPIWAPVTTSQFDEKEDQAAKDEAERAVDEVHGWNTENLDEIEQRVDKLARDAAKILGSAAHS